MVKEKGRQWDGKSRVSNDVYRENFNKIFGVKEKKEVEDPFKKEQEELRESYDQSKKSKEEREKLLKEIEDRNGF